MRRATLVSIYVASNISIHVEGEEEEVIQVIAEII